MKSRKTIGISEAAALCGVLCSTLGYRVLGAKRIHAIALMTLPKENS